jgi:uncharacterized protein YcbX
MRVLEIWRYPVKSLQGERVDVAEVTSTGLAGDRGHAIFDPVTGFGLTARRVPELLFASATVSESGTVRIELPDGRVAADDATLSDWLGRPVTLRAAHDDRTARHYENPRDFEDEATGDWYAFEGSPDAFHDSRFARVSLVSTTTVGAWHGRRFRANLCVDGGGEDELVGHRVAVGSSVLEVTKRLSRCVMTTRPQPGGIERDLDVFRTINREHDGCLAIGARVAVPGRVRIGDEVADLGRA